MAAVAMQCAKCDADAVADADVQLLKGQCQRFPGLLGHSCRYACLGRPCNPCRWFALGKCKKKKEEACKFCHIRPPPGLGPPLMPPMASWPGKELPVEGREEVRRAELEEPPQQGGAAPPPPPAAAAAPREEPAEPVGASGGDEAVAARERPELEQSEDEVKEYVEFLVKKVGEAPAARLLLQHLRSSLGGGRESNEDRQGLYHTKKLIEEMDDFYGCGPHRSPTPPSAAVEQRPPPAGGCPSRGPSAQEIWRFGCGGELHSDLRCKVQEASSRQEIEGWLAVARLVESLMGSLKAKSRGVERIHFEEDDDLATLQRQLLEVTKPAGSFEDCRQSLRLKFGDVLANSRVVWAL